MRWRSRRRPVASVLRRARTSSRSWKACSTRRRARAYARCARKRRPRCASGASGANRARSAASNASTSAPCGRWTSRRNGCGRKRGASLRSRFAACSGFALKVVDSRACTRPPLKLLGICRTTRSPAWSRAFRASRPLFRRRGPGGAAARRRARVLDAASKRRKPRRGYAPRCLPRPTPRREGVGEPGARAYEHAGIRASACAVAASRRKRHSA